MDTDHEESHGTRIGELNGWWAFMLKVWLVLMPILLTGTLSLCVWLIGEAYANRSFRTSGERFSKIDGWALEERMRERVEAEHSVQEARYGALESRLRTVEERLTRILAILENEHK